MSRVLVTGGPGFIGRRVVQRFLDAGWDVTSFSLPGEQPIASWSGPVLMVQGYLEDAAACQTNDEAYVWGLNLLRACRAKAIKS